MREIWKLFGWWSVAFVASIFSAVVGACLWLFCEKSQTIDLLSPVLWLGGIIAAIFIRSAYVMKHAEYFRGDTAEDELEPREEYRSTFEE